MTELHELIVGDDDHDVRVDRFVRLHVVGLSRGATMRLLYGGQVLVNGRAVGVEHQLERGDRVRVEPATQRTAQPTPLSPHDVLFNDATLVAVNKPAGLDLAGAREQAEAMAGDSLEVVNELDRQASGVLLLARTADAKRALNRQLARRTVVEHYRAVANGRIIDDEDEVRAPLSATPASRSGKHYVKTRGGGKKAITHYRVVERRSDQTLVDLSPRTACREQLRAHLAHLGHPLVGDVRYGGPPAERLLLHLSAIELRHPDDERQIRIAAPMPTELRASEPS